MSLCSRIAGRVTRTLSCWGSAVVAWRRTRSFRWAKKFHEFGNPSRAVRVDRATGRLLLEELGIAIETPRHDFLLQAYPNALALRRAGAEFRISDVDEVSVLVSGILAVVRTAEDFFMLREIHLEGVYNMRLAGPVLVFDIGMNVGFASLYFAKRMPDAIVESFEPLRPTWQRALINLSLNPDLANRIHVHQYGLASATTDAEVEYADSCSASVGAFGIPASRPRTSEFRKERIQLRDVVSVFDEIVAGVPERRILLKIDCEGAEYAIIERLKVAGRLDMVDAVVLEWHRLRDEHRVERLRDALESSGFVCVVLNPVWNGTGDDTGMLYAVNSAHNDKRGVMSIAGDEEERELRSARGVRGRRSESSPPADTFTPDARIR